MATKEGRAAIRCGARQLAQRQRPAPPERANAAAAMDVAAAPRRPRHALSLPLPATRRDDARVRSAQQQREGARDLRPVQCANGAAVRACEPAAADRVAQPAVARVTARTPPGYAQAWAT